MKKTLCDELVISIQDGGRFVRGCARSHNQAVATLALLEILALGTHQVETGKVRPATTVLKEIRRKREIR